MDFDKRPIEWRFVSRLAHCIRLHNALNKPPLGFPLSDTHRADFERKLKEYSDERKRYEAEIGEIHKLNYYAFRRIIKELYHDMNEADGGFEMGKGSPMYQNFEEFVTKFTDAIKKIKEDGGDATETQKD